MKAASSLFWQLIQGMGWHDLAVLRRTSRGIGVYQWDPILKTCSPGGGLGTSPQVAWPITWLLGAHHFKHRWCERANPDVDMVNNAVQQWTNKLQWRAALEDQPCNPWYSLETKKPATRPCENLVERLDTFIMRIRSGIHNAAVAAQWTHKKFFKPPLVLLAKRLIQESSSVYVKTDKDGGFASTPTEKLVECYHSILEDSSKYTLVNACSHISDELIGEYGRIVGDWVELLIPHSDKDGRRDLKKVC